MTEVLKKAISLYGDEAQENQCIEEMAELIQAINITWAIFFSVMRDKEGYGKKRLRRVWDGVNELSDSIAQGYVNVKDLMRTLAEEAGIYLEG